LSGENGLVLFGSGLVGRGKMEFWVDRQGGLDWGNFRDWLGDLGIKEGSIYSRSTKVLHCLPPGVFGVGKLVFCFSEVEACLLWVIDTRAGLLEFCK